MFQSELPRYLPTADELPCSDDTPVDEDWSRRFPPAKEVRNELQELIPGLLKSILQILWADRMDWFFGIDMGIYYHPEQPPIVPDGFLSLGVERFYDEELRPSYVLWEEQVVPSLVLEVVSTTPGREYTTKLDDYAQMGVLYYVIYNSRRRRKPKLEIHKLIRGNYELQDSNPVWMPEIGLGIGYERGEYGGITRDWLYWYDENNQRYPTPAEQIRQGQIQIRQGQIQIDRERDRSNRLAAKLRALGIDPDEV